MEQETVTKPKRQRRKKKDSRNPAESLIRALKFIQPIQKKTGSVQQQYCLMNNHWLVACSDNVTAATPIQEDLFAYPHTYKLMEALSHCNPEMSIVQTDQVSLTVSSYPFMANIPCCDGGDLNFDAPIMAMLDIENKNIEHVFEVLTPIINSKPDEITGNIMLTDNIATATNGSLLIEFWHGATIGVTLFIPELPLTVAIKSGKDLQSMGYDNEKVTLYFKDGSMVVGNTFLHQFPEYQQLFEGKLNSHYIGRLPEEFFAAIKSISYFCKDGLIHFGTDFIFCQSEDHKSSSYTIPIDLPEGLAFSMDDLLILETLNVEVSYNYQENKLYFNNSFVRGVMVGQQTPTENTIEG